MQTTAIIQDIPFNKLIPTQANIRKVSPEEADTDDTAAVVETVKPLDPALPGHIRSLAANILAHGLLQPLGVAPHPKKIGHYVVHFGNRRYTALAALVKAGHLGAKDPVSCRVGESTAALAEALSENVLREAMHPLDEAEAFRALMHEGLNVVDIAARFGVPIRTVQQRLRLAELHPDIAQAYRERQLRLEQVQALACTPDHDAQWQAYERGRAYPWQLEPNEIRRFLRARGVKGDHRLAVYVGRDAYRTSGGVIEETLFDEADLWHSVPVLETLAEQKLQAEARALVEAGQYGEVRPLLQRPEGPTWQEREGLRQIEPMQRPLSDEAAEQLATLKAELEALQAQEDLSDEEAEAYEQIEQKIAALQAGQSFYPPEVASDAIAFLYVNAEGQSQVWEDLYRPVKPASAPALSNPTHAVEGVGHENTDQVSAATPLPAGGTAPGGKPFSSALLQDLAVQRGQVLAAALSRAPDLAYDAVVFLLASQLLAIGLSLRSEFGFELHAEAGIDPDRQPDTQASHGLQDRMSKLETAWLDESDLGARFVAFRALSADQKGELLAVCLALMCQPSLNPQTAGSAAWRAPFHDVLGQILAINVRDWWSPLASGYWSRMTRAHCLDALDAIETSHLRPSYESQKKHALAEALERLFRGEGHVGKKISARARSWTPPLLSFAALAGLEADNSCDVEGVLETPVTDGDEAVSAANPSLEDAA